MIRTNSWERVSYNNSINTFQFLYILPNFKYWLSNLHFVWYSPISIFCCRFRKRWCKKTKIQNQFFAVATWRIRKSISILSLPRCIHERGYGPKIRPQRIQNFGKNFFSNECFDLIFDARWRHVIQKISFILKCYFWSI